MEAKRGMACIVTRLILGVMLVKLCTLYLLTGQVTHVERYYLPLFDATDLHLNTGSQRLTFI